MAMRIGEALKLQSRDAMCDAHGPYLSRTFGSNGIWTGCPTCMTERQEKEERERAEAGEKERKDIAIRNAIKSAAIPKRFMERTLGNFVSETPEQTKAHAIASGYAENFRDCMKSGRSLVFCGTPGTGKTHLAIGIAHQAITDGYSAGFISAMNAVRRVRESYRRGSDETERQAIDAFARPDLLILDEVGQQRGTDDEAMLLFDIINARYEAVRPTIVISNLDLAGIRKYLGDRSFDRLREGGGTAVQFTWESYRKSV